MLKVQGWVEEGNTRVNMGGLTSSNTVQGSFPGASVLVTIHGTGGTKASIYSDDLVTPTPLANAFVSNADGSFGFYVTALRIDITFSGGGLPAPITLFDIQSMGDTGIPSYGNANFPDPKTQDAGNLARNVDAPGGLYMNSGIQWVRETQYIDVMEAPFNAKCDGVTDDAVAVNLAATYLRSLSHYIPGAQQQTNPGVLRFPSGRTCVIGTSINLQLIRAYGWGIYARGATIIGKTIGYPVFDCLGSAYGVFDDVYIIGDSTNKPSVGIQTGRIDMIGNQAGSHQFNNYKSDGYFTRGSLFNSGGEGNVWLNPIITNLQPNAFAFMIDGLHHYVPQTLYTPSDFPVDSADSCIQHTVINCAFNGSQIGSSIFLSNVNQLSITGYATSSDSPVILYLTGAGLTNARDLNIDIHVETTPTCIIRFDAVSAIGQMTLEGFNLRDALSGVTVALMQNGTNITQVAIRSGDLFKGSGVTVPFTDGVVLMQSAVRQNYTYPKLSAYTPQLSNNTVYSFDMPGLSTAAQITVTSDTGGTECATIWGRANVSPATQDIGTGQRGSDVNITTGILTGTTGSNGKMTISCASNGKVYVENRLGGVRNFAIQLVGI